MIYARHMSDTTYAYYPTFAIDRTRAPEDRDLAVKEVRRLFEEREGRVQLRGAYVTTGFTARADLMLWVVASSPDDVQEITIDLARTRLGAAMTQRDAFLGVVRPAEFAKDHLPAFAQGKPPKPYVCVYPFVRTPEWYLLPPEERNALLREHGGAGREFDDIQPNTTSAFGLGDWEWILAFEADALDRIVDLIRRLRATEARRYTKVETPFVTGILRDLPDAVAAVC